MKHLLFTLLAAVAFVACSSDDDAPKSISLTDGTSKTQTVYADQTSAGDGIHFKADAEWYAQVDEVQTKAGGSNVSWIELSRYNGSAGEYTLSLTIAPNTTGSDRSAKIVIVCGTDKITILIEQRSTTESGDDFDKPSDRDPNIVEKIEAYDDDFLCGVWEFTYGDDSSIGLTKIKYTERNQMVGSPGESGGVETVLYETLITYGDRTISYAMTRNGEKWDSATATLNVFQQVISATGTYCEDRGTVQTYGYSYTLTYDGPQLVASSRKDEDNSSASEERCVWSAGNLTQVYWGATPLGYETHDQLQYGTTSNQASLDLNCLPELHEAEGLVFAAGDHNRVFALMGLTGRRSDYLITKEIEDYDNSNSSSYADRTYTYTYTCAAGSSFPNQIVRERSSSNSKPYTYRITYR